MTHNEAIILSAYTGFLLVEDFSDVHKFCEDLLGRPIFTSEFADDLVLKEIREKCKPLLFEMQKPKTNYDRIKSMSIDEMANFIADIYADNEHAEIRINGEWLDSEDIEQWLESEVEE